MEQAEAAIADAKSKKPAFLQLVEHGAKTYQDVAEDIAALDSATAGSAFESTVARNELEKIAFVSDEQGIRDAATSMDTWLGGNNPDEAQELLDLMVQKVMVSSSSGFGRLSRAHADRRTPRGHHRGPGATVPKR